MHSVAPAIVYVSFYGQWQVARSLLKIFGATVDIKSYNVSAIPLIPSTC